MDIERILKVVDAATPAPLHQKLREAIQEQISDQTLKPGDAIPSERVMKDALGISRATVRQAINTLIRDGYLQSIAGTGTFVLEQVVPSVYAGSIGLMTSSPNFNFFYPQLAAAFNHRLRRAGYGLLMSLHNEHAEQLDQLVRELLQQNAVALAITPPRYGDMTDTIARLRRLKIPTVFIGRNVPASYVDVVATDNQSIGYAATRHLIELGHRHIAYVGLVGYSTGEERVGGYLRAMAEAGLASHIYPIVEQADATNAVNGGVLREHLAEPAKLAVQQIWNPAENHLPTPTAVFCFNDIIAMGVYKALRDMNYQIPHDVSLISVDNLITIRHFEVPLSTFTLPGELIGTRSAEVLLNRLAGDSSPAATLLLPAEFVPRSSTAAPPA